jgi:hypothetical protein
LVLLPALLLALPGCGGAPRAMSLSVQPSVAQMQAFRGVWPEFEYYPDYGVYHSRNYELYVFRGLFGWVTRTSPPNFPAGTLERARVVRMDPHFSDPIGEHEEISRRYPAKPGDR